MKAHRVVVIALMLAATPVTGEDLREPIITAPPPPEELTLDPESEPRVTIIEREWATIEEYSINGQVYAVKVTPAVGPPYYFYDLDGAGTWRRYDDPASIPVLRQWKLLEW